MFRQINVRQQRLRSLPPPLHMLTHRFNLLSNPVSPGVCPSLNIRYPEGNPLPCMEEMQRNPHINRHARTGFRMAYSRLSGMFPFLMECKITTFSSNEQIILAKSYLHDRFSSHYQPSLQCSPFSLPSVGKRKISPYRHAN